MGHLASERSSQKKVIMELADQGLSNRKIAKKVGVSKTTVGKIRRFADGTEVNREHIFYIVDIKDTNLIKFGHSAWSQRPNNYKGGELKVLFKESYQFCITLESIVIKLLNYKDKIRVGNEYTNASYEELLTTVNQVIDLLTGGQRTIWD